MSSGRRSVDCLHYQQCLESKCLRAQLVRRPLPTCVSPKVLPRRRVFPLTPREARAGPVAARAAPGPAFARWVAFTWHTFALTGRVFILLYNHLLGVQWNYRIFSLFCSKRNGHEDSIRQTC